MDLGLKGKVALVTASTEGIGFAIAKELGREGACVYINGRSREKVEKAMGQLQQEKLLGELRPAPFDLSSKEGVDGLIERIPSIDILVNNLGSYEVKPFEDISDEDWGRMFEVNVLSGVRLSRHYFPAMKEKNWGRIVFISSESAVNIPVEMIHYGVTKTAQLALARGLAEKTVGTKVTVNSVLPGPTYSSGVQVYVDQMAKSKGITPQQVEEEFFKTVRPGSLIQRFANTEEVAALVAFICSERAAAINGAALRVEGGLLRSLI